jgi:hypothetical protein
MFHRASRRPVCIRSVWCKEKVVAPEGITVTELVAICTLPGTSGGAGEKAVVVKTSVAEDGEPTRRRRETSISIVSNPQPKGDFPGKDIPVQEFAPGHG